MRLGWVGHVSRENLTVTLEGEILIDHTISRRLRPRKHGITRRVDDNAGFSFTYI